MCKKRIYDLHITDLLKFRDGDGITADKIHSWIVDHTWNRKTTFNLVSHGNNGRPCFTISGSKPGKPCIFPFVYPDCNLYPPTKPCSIKPKPPPTINYQCYPEGSGSWCSTRIHWNDSHITGEFGSCPPNCKTNYNSTKNLASSEFPLLWDEGFYRLFDDDIGHCHTYNPGQRSSTSPDMRFIALMGKSHTTKI